MKKTTTARAPATVANLICGFDTLALAIDGMYDDVSITPNDLGEWRITSIENGGKIPLDPTKNVCTAAMEVMKNDLGDKNGYDVQIVKGYQAGSGLGSSAASAVAALWAYNAQLDFPLTKEQIVPYAMLSEKLVSGKAIADNVAASAIGGIVLIRSASEHDFISLPSPDIFVTCLLPDVQIITKDAREILPNEFPLEAVVQQGANLAGFISSLYSYDMELLGRSMVDHLIEPHRAPLIPSYFDAKKIAMNDGAISFGISGSGPAIFFLSDAEMDAQRIANQIKSMWSEQQIKCTVNISKINELGVSIIS